MPSVAQNAFAKARSEVTAWALDHQGRSPALTLQVRPRERSASVPPGEGNEGRGPLVAAARNIALGQVRSVDLVRASLEALDAHKDLNPMAFVDEETALAEAASMDHEVQTGHLRGPLHGIPLTIKDIIDVAGMPTRAGSEAYESHPMRDAEVVTRLKAAGAVVIGKATAHEFGLGVTTPQSRNPHDPTRIPGGSSGGSAIAVATGIGLASVGTDTRASVRTPSALSGVVGFKATFGQVPTQGVIALSWSMDHIGPLAKTVGDATYMLDVMARPSPGLSEFVGAPVDGLRLGVPASAFSDCHEGVTRAVQEAIEALEGLGVQVVPVTRPSADDFRISNAAGLIVSRSEAAAYHRGIGTDLGRCWAETRDQLEEGGKVPAHEYLAAQRCRAQLMDEMLEVFDGVDALAMPTSNVPAPRVEEAENYFTVLSRNVIPWSFVGFPAISVPCRSKADGLPVGLQLIAPPYEEKVLVALGTAYERS